jgi:Carboxypeptidase regulatory-like domain
MRREPHFGLFQAVAHNIHRKMGRATALALVLLIPWCAGDPLCRAQGETTSAIAGQVTDASGAAVPGAGVTVINRGTGLQRWVKADEEGRFDFPRVAPGFYSVEAEAPNFRNERRELSLRRGQVAHLTIPLGVRAVQQEITVAAGTANATSLNVNETQLNSGLVQKLPSESANAALSSILTLATPGVAADSNGVFHPLGEHAETSFSVDGQPISDQQSRIFSNQVALDTIKEMKTLQGAPPAEFGDKTSLIVEVTTRSGLNAGRARGDFAVGYGSFATPTASSTLSAGNDKVGNFLALYGTNSDRFLDTPEFQPLHATGNAENLFDRIDWRPSNLTAVHVNLSAARSWFQVPNTYDQQAAQQDQRQQMTSFNADLGYSRVLAADRYLTANAWLRQDRVNYAPSANFLADQPATLSQSRQLTSWGAKADLAYAPGRHTFQSGVQLQAWPLSETFAIGLTDPAFNSPCVDSHGVPVPDASLSSPFQCAGGGFIPNPAFQAGLVPYDLARGGSLFQFRGAATIREESAYAQDGIRLGRLDLNLGLRYDNYDGLGKGSAFQPRVGFAYHVHATGTVLHLSYARVFLTPYNENLVLSSATGAGGLANSPLGASRIVPLTPARRNQFNAGFEQRVARILTVEGEYFWKFTRGAYDFNTILNTPLNFPIQFRKAKIDGAMVRVTLRPVHGFSAFAVLGHTRSRLFGPEIGGINFGTGYAPVARPDHDQGFEQTTNLQYQFPSRTLKGLWIGLTWRFDSGLVVVSVPDYSTALTLTGDEQHAMGLYCGDVVADVHRPLRTCNSPHFGATLVRIAPSGTYNPDTNPSRIAPHSLFDVALGSDSLWKKEDYSVGLKLTAVNVTDKVALYNFLSSFSGTHFISPRTLRAEITFHF